MGVHGFKKWLENHDVTRVSKNSTDAFHHVFLDMNCLLHSSYDRRDPTIAGTRSRLFMLLDKLYARFPAKLSLNVIFDGPAPLAKLATQRLRRRGYSDPQQQGADVLSEGEITTGSTFMLETEKLVEAHLQKRLESGTLLARQVVFSGTRAPGEGEAKISQLLLELANRGPNEACDDPGYHPDECICIIGNDSDLVVHCIAAVPYHNLFVAHPVSFVLTSVGDLLLSWMRGNSAAFTLAQLPSARLDFCFLTQLAGCDHYEGIGDEVFAAWRVYRGLRCKPHRFSSRLVTLQTTTSATAPSTATAPASEEGVAAAPEVTAAAAVDPQPRLVINTAFLREVLAPDARFGGHHRKSGGGRMGGSKWNQARREFDRQQKNRKKANPEAGIHLVQAALWSLGAPCFGACPDYTYRWQGSAASIQSLVSASRSANLGKIASPRGDALPPLSPLQLFVAITAKPKLLPGPVQQLLETDPVLKRLTQYDSTASVVNAVGAIFAQISPQSVAWSPLERELLRFAHPRRYVRHGPKSVTVVDPYVPMAPSESFATFQYSIEVLTQGIHMAALQPTDYCATVKLSANQLTAYLEGLNKVRQGGGAAAASRGDNAASDDSLSGSSADEGEGVDDD